MTIDEIIQRDYSPEEQPPVQTHLAPVLAGEYGAGSERLARTLLCIAGGSFNQFKRLFPISEPRDLFMEVGRLPEERRAAYFEPAAP